MLARLQQFTTFAMIALALVWTVAFAGRGQPTVAVGGALIIVFAYGFVLAVELLLSRRINRDEPILQAGVYTLLSAWWGEVACAARVFFWSQPFRSHAVPDQLVQLGSEGVGIVFIHGFACNRGIWNPWLRRLDALGAPYVAVNLEPVFGDIERYATVIDSAVRQIEATTGSPPLVVAHSMGGLAVRAWLTANDTASRVRHVFTLGTPHGGTLLARFALATNAKQMRRHSPWLQALAGREPSDRYAMFTCYFSHCDNVVLPATSATLPGANNRHLYGVAHVQMANDERVFSDILEHLRSVPQRPARTFR